MAQLAERSPHMHRALGLILRARCGGDSCHASTGEVKAGKPKVQGHLQLHSDSEAKDGGSKKRNKGEIDGLPNSSLQEARRLWERGRLSD